jgi:hypothetical protein
MGQFIDLLEWPATGRFLLRRNCEHGSMYRGVERRFIPRQQGPKPAVILLEPDVLLECTVQDFSPAGAGLIAPDAAILPPAFDLRFGHITRHCTVVWRQLYCMGLKFKSRD